MKVSTEIDNNFGYEKITQLVDNINFGYEKITQLVAILSTSCVIFSYPKLLSISVLTFIK